MPKNVLHEQLLETVGHLVEEHKSRGHVQDALDEIEVEIDRLKALIDDQKTIRENAREELDKCEARILALVAELDALSNGRPRLPNINPQVAEADKRDPAETHGIGELVRFGQTEKQIEKLTESVLARELSIKSVGDFIRAIDKDPWWHRKVKGWGESAIEKATDALMAYRKTYPVPDDDERPKSCRKCLEVYPASKSKCPRCDATTFELVGHPDDAPPETETEVVDADAELVEA